MAGVIRTVGGVGDIAWKGTAMVPGETVIDWSALGVGRMGSLGLPPFLHQRGGLLLKLSPTKIPYASREIIV